MFLASNSECYLHWCQHESALHSFVYPCMHFLFKFMAYLTNQIAVAKTLENLSMHIPISIAMWSSH